MPQSASKGKVNLQFGSLVPTLRLMPICFSKNEDLKRFQAESTSMHVCKEPKKANRPGSYRLITEGIISLTVEVRD